jgi:hypothetical protein
MRQPRDQLIGPHRRLFLTTFIALHMHQSVWSGQDCGPLSGPDCRANYRRGARTSEDLAHQGATAPEDSRRDRARSAQRTALLTDQSDQPTVDLARLIRRNY